MKESIPREIARLQMCELVGEDRRQLRAGIGLALLFGEQDRRPPKADQAG